MSNCSRCGSDKQVIGKGEITNIDLRTHERSTISIKLCKDCLNDVCYCDICLAKTTHDSYKDHLNEHEKEKLIERLYLHKLNAEHNILDY